MSRRGAADSEKLLLAAIAVLLLAIWLEPPGSWLAEPDEPRYAEIPREMLASGDFVTPHLNGVPYFEKPPMLYWANAAALATFGQSPWAARLATRLAGLGTTLLIAFAVARARGRRAGIAAAALFLSGAVVLTLSRLNLTDGVLTFFFTATLLAARATIERHAAGRSSAGLSALAGALAAAGFLSKGLLAIVLPGGILFFWCLATRRAGSLRSLLLGPAVPVFLVVAAPWFLLAERRNPGFLHFFFIHEHFQRFATTEASRPGPIYYFVGVVVLGFLPGLPFFFAGLARIRRDPDALFYAIWFAVVLVFFSVSRSKLVPYVFPAFPAAAALAARGFAENAERRARWLAAALLAIVTLAAVAAVPVVRSTLVQSGTAPIAIAGGLFLLAGSSIAYRLRHRSGQALALLTGGWGTFYVALALLYPHTPPARELHVLARAASDAVSRSPASIVFYRTYVQTVPWELQSTFPVADHTGELEYWFVPEARRREIFWSRDDFWKAWSERPILAVARTRDRGDFPPTARWIETRGKYGLVTNR